MDFTPKPTEQKPTPPPTYELKKDVTGKPAPKRGAQVLFAYKQNEKKETVKVQFKVPMAPQAKCKKCLGRGYIGFEARSGNIIPCRKCYPML